MDLNDILDGESTSLDLALGDRLASGKTINPEAALRISCRN